MHTGILVREMCMHADHMAIGGPEHSFYPIRISTDSLSTHPLDTHSLMPPRVPVTRHNSEQLQ